MENNNSVCFVAQIEKINPIEGADKIVQAIISGWECVIQKDTFNVGDQVVIATNDAIIPFELAEKLGVTSYLKHRKKTNQYTVRTTKLRGVYSQALIVKDFSSSKVGTDMMDAFGIFKYEEPAIEVQTTSGKKIRYHKNPNFHVYYKFPNAKNVPNMFTPYDIVSITRKMHGTNARYGIVKKPKLTILDKVKRLFGNKWVEYDFVYGSHNVEKGSDSQGYYSKDVWLEVAKQFRIKEKLWDRVKTFSKEKLGDGLIIYGEIFGAGIQKYYDYGLKNEQSIVFFDAKCNNEYLHLDDFKSLLFTLQLPIVEELKIIPYNEEHLQHITSSFFKRNIEGGKKVPEEGVVVKSITGDRAKIAKFINPAYLEFQSKNDDSTDFH